MSQKTALKNLLEASEEYCDTVQEYYEASQFDDEDEMAAANRKAERVYNRLLRAQANARDVLAKAVAEAMRK